MPAYSSFNGSGNPSLSVLLQGSSLDLYVGCWVRIDPSFTSSSLYIARIGAATQASNDFLTFLELVVSNNQLSASWAKPGTDKEDFRVINSTDDSTLSDGQWHHLGVYVNAALVNSDTYGQIAGLSCCFFKDGNSTSDGVIVTQLDPSNLSDDGLSYNLTLADPPLDGGGFEATPFTGDIAMVHCQSNLVSPFLAIKPNDVTSYLLDNFIKGVYNSVPRVDADTLGLIGFFPAELNTGLQAYTNLVNNEALDYNDGVTIDYCVDTFLDGLTEMVSYAPSADFPGSDDDPDAFSDALLYIIQHLDIPVLKSDSISDFRSQYTDLSMPADDAYAAAKLLTYPNDGVEFSAEDFSNAQSQLEDELSSVSVVQAFYSALQSYIEAMSTGDLSNFIALENHLSENTATLDSNIGDVVTILATILELASLETTSSEGTLEDNDVTKKAGTILEGLFAAANLYKSETPHEAVTYPLGSFQGPLANVSDAINAAWTSSHNEAVSAASLILQDWGKLQLVAPYHTSNIFVWNLNSDSIPDDWNSQSQLNYLRQILPQLYNRTYFYIQGKPIQTPCAGDLNLVPVPMILQRGEALRYFETTAPMLIGNVDTDDIDVKKAPSEDLSDYLFNDENLGCNPYIFWCEWPWNVVGINCFNPRTASNSA